MSVDVLCRVFSRMSWERTTEEFFSSNTLAACAVVFGGSGGRCSVSEEGHNVS